jgi:predicted glycoside hydrolase/deacetylase ChbG (UPF0249 family)
VFTLTFIKGPQFYLLTQFQAWWIRKRNGFRQKFTLLIPLIRQILNPTDLKAEFRAQIENFRQFGIEPSHLDNHRPEIYLNYDLFKVVIELAVEFKLPIRMPFDAAFAAGDQTLSQVSGFSWRESQNIGSRIRSELVRENIRTPDYFIYSFTAGERTEQSLLEILRSLPIGISEICTHPGLRGDRQTTELGILKSQVIREAINQNGIRLGSFDLLRFQHDHHENH